MMKAREVIAKLYVPSPLEDVYGVSAMLEASKEG